MKTTPTLPTLLSLVLTSMVAFAAPPAPIDPANYTAPIRVACVGDSITKGMGAEGEVISQPITGVARRQMERAKLRRQRTDFVETRQCSDLEREALQGCARL